jgi:hypothetical protein
LSALFLLFSDEIAAQTKQRIVLNKRVNKVTGTLMGDEVRQYVFRLRKHTNIHISVVHNYFEEPIKPHPKFVVFKSNGKLLFDDQQPGTDLLEVLSPGEYTIRLQLPENMRNNGNPVKFTLQLTLK